MLCGSVFLLDGISWTVNTAIEFISVVAMVSTILFAIESVEAAVMDL